MLKTFTSFFALIFFTFCWIGCTSNENPKNKENAEIVILYENDVHCAIDGYAKFSGLKNELSKIHSNVAAVSVGDFVQGDSLGAISKGTNWNNQVPSDMVVNFNYQGE